MNRPTSPELIEDVQNIADKRHLDIDQVGIKAIKHPIVVIQHMPENFTKALADRLNKQCQVTVKEASNGDALKPGHVYIAPGGHQCIFDRSNLS